MALREISVDEPLDSTDAAPQKAQKIVELSLDDPLDGEKPARIDLRQQERLKAADRQSALRSQEQGVKGPMATTPEKPFRISMPGSVMDNRPATQDQSLSIVQDNAVPSFRPIRPSGNIEARDMGLALKQGGADIGTAVGKGLRYLGAEKIGSALQEAGTRQAEDAGYLMSTAGGMAAEGQIVTDDISWGDTPFSSATLQALRSAPGMVATMPFGAAGGKIIEGIGGKALQRLASHPGVIGKIASVAPTAIGAGAAEGIQAALLNAAQTERDIMLRPIEEIRRSPKYAELMAQTDSGQPVTQREKQVRAAIAKLASDEVAFKTLVSTGGIGILTGGGAQGMVLRRIGNKSADSVLKSTVKGAAEEAIQEAPQSSGEQYIQNAAEKTFLDPSKNVMEGVVGAGLSGAAVGGLTGGVMGGGGAAIHSVPHVIESNRDLTHGLEINQDAIDAIVRQSLDPENAQIVRTGGVKYPTVPVSDPVMNQITNTAEMSPAVPDTSEFDSLLTDEQSDLAYRRRDMQEGIQKQNEMDAIQQQSREVLGRTPDQQLAAASVATDEEPTAMEIAFRRALHGSRADLESVLADPRPIEQIREEQNAKVKQADEIHSTGAQKTRSAISDTAKKLTEFQRRRKNGQRYPEESTPGLTQGSQEERPVLQGGGTDSGIEDVGGNGGIHDGSGVNVPGSESLVPSEYALQESPVDQDIAVSPETIKENESRPEVAPGKSAQQSSLENSNGQRQETPEVLNSPEESGNTEPVAPVQTPETPPQAQPVPVATAQTNKEPSYTKGQAQLYAKRMTNQGMPSEAYPHPIDSGKWSIRPVAEANIEIEAHKAATSPLNDIPEPTVAQKEAGNYAKGHIKFQGMDISIENPAGSTRSGTDANGRPWEIQMKHHYGYIKGTIGRDKDHLDVFIKPHAKTAGTAYVIDQIDPKSGRFDEHKIVFGADSEADARSVYLSNYESGWQGLGAITSMPMADFKDWLKSGNTKKPISYSEPKTVKAEQRKKPASNTLIQAIINRGGINRSIMQDVGADPKGRYQPGLFTKEGTTDLSNLADALFNEDGFHQISMTSDIGPGRELEDLVTRAVHGERIVNTVAMEAEKLAEMTAKHKAEIIGLANEYGIETKDGVRNRPLEDVEQEVKSALVFEVGVAGKAYSEIRAQALNDGISEDDISKLEDSIADAYFSDIRSDKDVLMYREMANAIQEKIDAANVETGKGKSAESDLSPRGNGEEDRPGLELSGQTEEEIRADQERVAKEEAKARAEDQSSDLKSKADSERNSFSLTGSNRPADVLAAQGQGGLFDAPTEDNSSQSPESKKEESIKKSEIKISDFGEKIGGARKDVWTSFKDSLRERVSDEDILVQPLSKTWPEPDYQKLIDDGADSWIVGFVRAARDEVPRKPSSTYKQSTWKEQVKLLRDTSSKLLNGDYSKDSVQKLIREKAPALRKLVSRVELYQEVGHSKSLAGITFDHHHYSIYRGRENVSLWVVEKAAKATAWSNWPSEIATGDTKEEMLASFKAKYSELNTDKEKSKEIAFDIYVQGGNYFVGKKIGRNIMELAGPFKTVKEARDYRNDNKASLVEKLEKRKEIPRERRDSNNPRVGEDMRGAQDVTPQMFGDVFGFRGVEFGNWVEQSKRQKDLNDAFDALMDMAAIIGVPPKALSLNGQLGLAFGARGTGGVNPAAAHYEADKIVINLTKKEGAGSLGHEWWHAVDNYFSRSRAKNSEFMTEAIDVSLASRDSEFVENTSVRKEMISAFGKVIRSINSTKLKARSSKLDAKRTKEYWTTKPEMSARAFESYLISKLQDQGASNDYLANIVDEKTWKAAESLGFELDESYPYPTAGEVPAIRAAFDNFFNTVQTKETEKGLAMFSREGYSREAVAHVAMQELAFEDEVFRYPTSSAKTLQSVMRDVFPGVKYIVESTRADEKQESGADHRYTFLTPDTPANDGKPERRGKQFDVFVTLDKVWIDVHRFQPGDQGSRVYAAVANFAYNTRRVFTGDPAGVSADAVVARTKMMLSSALRFGTTRHLEASREQEKGIPDEGIPPLNWRGNDVEKIRSLIHTFVMTAEKLEPSIKDYSYDFEKRTFVRNSDSKPAGILQGVGGSQLEPGNDGRGNSARTGAPRIGKDSGRAAILIQSLIRGESSKIGDGGILQAILDQSSALVKEGGLGGIFSRDGESSTGLTLEQSRSFIQDSISSWGNSPKVVVKESPSEWGISAPSDARGAYLNGTLYIASSNISSKKMLAFTIYHEGLGHYGLQGAFGSKLNSVLMRTWQVNPEVRSRTAKWISRNGDVIASQGMTDQKAKLRGIEEALSDMAGEGKIPKGLDAVLTKMIELLRSMGEWGNIIADWAAAKIQKVGVADTYATLASAKRFVEAEGMDQGFVANTGAINSNPDIQYSRIIDSAADLVDTVTMPSSKSFGVLKGLQTQMHKARNIPEYNRVFKLALAFRNDLSRSAYRPWENATDILPAYDNLKGAVSAIAHGKKGSKDITKAGQFIFEGTMHGGGNPLAGVVYSDSKLKSMGATDEQIRLYKQAREAINSSLDEIAAAVAWKHAKRFLDPSIKYVAINNPENAQSEFLDMLEIARDAAENLLGYPTPMKAVAAEKEIAATIKAVKEVFDHAERLKAAGYAPLMRFGNYTVDAFEVDPLGRVAKDAKGNPIRLSFQKFDTEIEAKVGEKEMKAAFASNPNVKIVRGVQSQEPSLFKGVDPETVSLFAEQIKKIPGLDVDKAVLDQYYREAVSSRSALTRTIKRKGVSGYSEDLPRVLASFLTSNARYAASTWHLGDMQEAINDIPKEMGDVVDESKQLLEYMNSINEPGAAIRGLMFTWFLGGSIASAAVNLSQPVLMTYPYLSQFGLKSAAEEMAKAVPAASSLKPIPASMRGAFQRAQQEGIVEAQEIHHLYQEGMRPIISMLPGGEDIRARAQGMATLWGAFFGAAENFNRRLTFVAAYSMAQKSKEIQKKFGSPYEFARRAVEETQGIYSKENRPNWARGTGPFGVVGVAGFTFKQYSIQYVELLTRMWGSGKEGKISAGLMIGLLIVASGLKGIPFSDDIKDLVDTILQSLGYLGNSEKDIRDKLSASLGERAADLVLYGLSSETPIDVQARLGLGNIIPATGVFKPSEKNKAQQLAEIFGPPGGLAKSVGMTVDAAQSGKFNDAFRVFSPKMVQDFIKGWQMLSTGEYRDSYGAKVADVSKSDAAIKAIGFQPMSVAGKTRKDRLVQQDVDRVKEIESDIADAWVKGIIDKDQQSVLSARKRLSDWNKSNPETQIRISPKQIRDKVVKMRMSREQRMVKSSPKEMRGYVAQGIK